MLGSIFVMKKKAVIELYEFTPIEGISDEALLKAVRKAQIYFFRKQKGFISCQILKSEKCWIGITFWSHEEAANTALSCFRMHPSCLPFIQMISPLTEKRLFLNKVLFCSTS